MFTISHAFAGILILRVLIIFFPESYTKSIFLILLSMFLANLPDLDAFFVKTLNGHHKTLFHAPFFWIVISLIIFIIARYSGIIPMTIALLFPCQVLSHLFFDTITTRSSGIRIFYPFSKKEYSVARQNTNMGNFRPFFGDIEKRVEMIKFYLSNKTLVAFEAIVASTGVISLIL